MGFFSNLFGFNSTTDLTPDTTSDVATDSTSNSTFNDFSMSDINPANGLPMVGAVDIEGNPYGTDSDSTFDDYNAESVFDNSMFDSDDSFSSFNTNDSFSSSFNDD